MPPGERHRWRDAASSGDVPSDRRLLENENQVLLETNGSREIVLVDHRCARIIDVKCPSSNEHQTCRMDNLTRMTPPDGLKFVVGDRQD